METAIRINFKLLLSWALILIVFYISLENIGNIKGLVYQLLNWQYIQLTYWALMLSCYVIRYFSDIDGDVRDALVYKYFGRFADTAFTIVTLALAGSTSLSLLKGIYSQKIIEDKVYFANFGDFDIWSLLVVSLFLLVYSLHMALNSLYVAIVNTSSVKLTPSDE
ncbi:MAG: hypothetical protein Tsb002_01140 [Wenzhouxiangellaceae bacterium]